MKVPVLKINPKPIQVPTILYMLGCFNDASKSPLVKFYRTIGGNMQDIARLKGIALLQYLCNNIENGVLRTFEEKLEPTPASYLAQEKNSERHKDVNIDLSAKVHISNQRGWIFTITYMMGFHYHIALEVLETLKSKKPLVYPIIRDLLALIIKSGTIPGLTALDIAEWIFPEDYLEDPESFEDLQTQKYYSKMVKHTISCYNRYIGKVKTAQKADHKKILRRSFRRFNKLPEGALTNNQKALIRDMFRLASLCEVSHKLSVYNDPDDEDDRTTMHFAFGFPWSDQDDIAEPYFNSIDEEWGNGGSPSVTIILKNKEDIVGATLELRRLMLLQRVCYWYTILTD